MTIILLAGLPAAAAQGGGLHSPLLLASYLVFGGIYQYYQVYERWPVHWLEVAQSGLVQAPLQSDAGEPINPDDGRLDFFGDITYEYVPGVSGPQVSIMLDRSLATPHVTALSPPLSYRELFAAVPPALQPSLPSADDKARLLQLGLTALCHEGISRYASAHANIFPGSWEQFLDSGFAPLTDTSINWLTGEVFYGDGRANDLLYQLVGLGFEILACDDAGNPIRLPITLPVCPWQCPRPAAGYEQLR